MKPKMFWLLCLSMAFALPSTALAGSQGASIQERRAIQEAQAMAMKKQQEVIIFKKQRDEMMLNYKALQQVKNQAMGQMKVAQRDYKAAMAKFTQTEQQEQAIESQIIQLQQNRNKLDAASFDNQLKKLRDSQSQLIQNMKNFSKLQQDSYEEMLNFDNQYRGLLAKEQILRQQIESVQRQLQFVISQP